MKFRRLMFVLPNLFTLTSIFCGFYAITLCAGEATAAQLYQAALAIFFAMFFDGFDGRVARLTKTQSFFGTELDSLADIVSFGVAPAVLVYKWALMPLGFIGMFVSFCYVACGALRLARFNVLAQRSNHGVAILSLLMVSTVRYRTFKDVRLSKKSASIFMLICATGVVIATQLHPAYVLLAYFSMYLVLGIIESGVLLKNHLAARKLAASTAAGTLLSSEEDEDEDANDVDEQDFL